MYNSEKFIGTCLDSILNSDLPSNDYEIIVVNDGSTDDGLKIVEEYMSSHNNISCLTQENKGLSGARNSGIDVAKGDYIWFVDADDRIDREISKILYSVYQVGDLDVYAFKLCDVSPDRTFLQFNCTQPLVKHNTVMSGREAVINGYNPSSVCALIIRRTFLQDNNLYFYPRISHQDVELTFRMFCVAQRVYFSDYAPYYYVKNIDSISQSVNPQKKLKYLCDDIIVIQSFRALADKFKDADPELADVIRNRSNNVLLGMVYSMRQNRKQWRELGIQDEIIKRLKEAGLYPMHCKFDSWKKSMMARFLNCECFIK